MPKPRDDKWKPTYVMIGKRLRWAREIRYDSQAQFARALDVDKSTIAKIESGDRGIPLNVLISAGNKLLTGADFLIYGELGRVHPKMLSALLKRHPELAETPSPRPTPQRQRSQSDWTTELDDVPPISDDTDTSNPGPRSTHRVRSDPS